jgi:hypothetical protein
MPGFPSLAGSKTVPRGAPKLTSSRQNDEKLRKDSLSGRFQFSRQRSPLEESIGGTSALEQARFLPR